MALDAVDVILRDGRTLRLRPPTASDADATVAFFSELSDRSRYLRFHGLAEISRNVVRPYLEPDWDERGALVATASDDGTAERIVALASYERLRDATTAECAFAVSDAMQGVGIGTRLLEQLAARAAAQGIQTFVAEVMGDNHGALTVFMEVGFAIDRKSEDGVVELRFPITSTEAYRERVDERDHVAVAASLEPFFTAKSVAVVGASRRTGSIGGDIFRNIIDADFTGTAYPVNGSGDPFAGVHGYTSIAEIGEPIDLAILAVPAARIIDAARGALECGVRALCVITSGFAEVGGDGRALEGELLALARAHGARLVGPNCLGIASTAVRLNATFAARPLPPGRIGFASQSGALGLALLERATERRLGFSSFVSIGNKADVSSNDLLEWWEEDDATDSILLYIESFGNPQKFGRVARRVARHKPILALKAGTTTAGARAASSHTAALTNSDTAVDALFRQAGVLRAQTLEELIDAASLLSSQPLPHGPRVAVVTNAGGLGILAADACEAAGLTLPSLSAETREALAKLVPAEASLANPIDILGSATPEIFEAVIPPILADAGIDALMVLFAQPIVADAEDVAAAVVRAAGMVAHEKPIVASMISANGTPAALLAAGSPVTPFAYPESAARALGFAAARRAWLRRPAGTIPQLNVDVAAGRGVVEAALGAHDDLWLDPSQTAELLNAFNIPLVPGIVATSVDRAVEAAENVGYPVVVKTAMPGVHKTESGGVAVDLVDDHAVREAVERIGTPVLVQPMLEGGVELLAGVVQDAVFGPLVAFGAGGVMAELIGRTGFRIAPLTDLDAEELVDEGPAGRLVRGFRGPALDASALTDLILGLSALAEAVPELAELDLNPVLGFPEGCVAADARVRVRRPAPGQSLKGW